MIVFENLALVSSFSEHQKICTERLKKPSVVNKNLYRNGYIKRGSLGLLEKLSILFLFISL